MAKAKLFLLTVLWLFSTTDAKTQYWHRTNPGGGGWMMSVGAGPTGTIVVGSDLSGAYRSNDGGQSWDVIGPASGLYASHVSTVGFDPVDGNILYLGTNKGIYRSDDDGDSMVHVLDFPNTGAVAIGDIKISLADPNIGYASIQPVWNSLQGVVYKTIDHGLSWSQVSVDLPNNLRILKLLINPTNSNIVYALSGFDRFACGPAELYRSTNGGANWTKLATAISDSMSIMDIAIDPLSPSTLYLTSMNVDCNSGVQYAGDIAKSIDGGDTWFDPNPNQSRSGIIWIKRDNPSIIRLIDIRKTAPWIPTSGTFTSTDGGVTWTQTGDESNWDTFYQTALNANLGTVIHNTYGNNLNYCRTLGEDLSDPDKMYWVNKRFVFGTDDGGTIFNNLFSQQDSSGGWQSNGVDNMIVYDIEISEADPNIVYAGYADNGLWRSLNGGASWESCNAPIYTDGWNGFGGNTYCIAPDPERPNTVWAVLRGTNDSHLVRSDSAGEINSWILSNNGLPQSTVITDISVDPNSDTNNRTLFTILAGNIYKSVDDGFNWTLSDSIGGLSFVEVDPNNSDIIYVGGSSGFYRSIDGGVTWVETGHSEMSTLGNTAYFWRKHYRGVSCIHPSSCEPGMIYVTAFGPGKGLYKSTDYGATWTKMIAGDYMRSVVISENNHKVILTGSSYLGYSGGLGDPSYFGFRYSLDGGLSWVIDDSEFEFPSIVDLELNHTNPELLFAASQGTGIQWAFDWTVPYKYYADVDNDSFGDPNTLLNHCLSSPPIGYVRDNTDCNDEDSTIHPNAIDIPNNGIDEDCDGLDLTTGLEDFESIKGINVFPNPFVSDLSISCECHEEGYIELVNVLGQTVWKEAFQIHHNEFNLQLSALPAGVYWIKIHSRNESAISVEQVLKIE